MSVFKNPYETTVCGAYRITPIQEALVKALSSGALRRLTWDPPQWDGEYDFALVQGGDAFSDVVPYFSHPLLVTLPTGRKTLCLDVRPFGKWVAPQARFVVRNQPEYHWTAMRGALQWLWLTQRPALLQDVSPLPATVYAKLVSECIARKFVLEPAERLAVQILAAYYYHCHFSDEKAFTDVERERLYAKLVKATRAPAQMVVKLVEDLPVLGLLEDFCRACQEKCTSGRLESFNAGILVAITTGNWFGTNARENLGVALEHMPTWFMIVYASLTEESFKRSVLAKMVQDQTKGDAKDQFLKGLNGLLGTPALLTQFDSGAQALG
jgi:hypothetical protein